MAKRRDEYDDGDDDDRDWSAHPYDEDQDDDFADEGFDGDDEDDDETVPCPHCRRPVYEDAERCPQCGNYLSREDAPHEAKPTWIVVTVIVVLAAILLTWLY
jgi:uncharacterized paraquat-inducible protein A